MTEKRDYRDTVFLPKTDFPMKAGLPAKEPRIAARWEEEGLYQQIRAAREGREKFILHDGPPYANGDMHIGHALNHILKDMVCRSQSLLGKDAPYVPGWDCHGLPIEWKVEEKYRKKKQNKDEVPPREFRQECRDYAQHWVDTQRSQLKRLGISGDWDNPYLTMQFDSEAGIVTELLKFAESGQLYRGAKPVMWSPVEKTALAEAEVEYEDITSTQIDVAFEIVESPIEALKGAYAVIWTTTPWTIPVNQALAYGPEVDYLLVRLRISETTQHLAGTTSTNVMSGYVSDGRVFLVARDRIREFASRIEASLNAASDRTDGKTFTVTAEDYYREVGDFDPYDSRYSHSGKSLAGTVARHPMHHLGGFYAEPRPLLPGDFVTTDSGTGLVHMAPDHGEDDFDLCKAHGIGPKFVVDAGGVYKDDWLWLGADDLDDEGKPRRRSVINPGFNAPDGPICSDLRAVGALLSARNDETTRHSYPHSWRSKAKVIYRCTPQWFVPMDKPVKPFDFPTAVPDALGAAVALGVQADHTATLRETALAEIEKTRFVPAKGQNRIRSMVEGRPDWVLSRQRAWGVPITLFVDRKSGEYLVDPQVNRRIIEAIRTEGVDGWDPDSAAQLLGPDYNPDDYEMVKDILDVWFDSGCTHAFVLESGRWPDLQSPADLYLEGSDQHRGWFQSSLLESCATRGRAPYKAVLTHGFTMAADGRKMSKSLGNSIDPLKVMEEFGADIIRLWALSVDFTEDHRIGPEILKGVGDSYRKLRNTFRYMLGALDGFSDDEKVEVADMPELERYVLALLGELDGKLRQAIADFDFNAYTRALTDFANEDLSAFFFDIRKDRLYCDAPDGLERRAYRTVLDVLFHALVRYAAPVLVFTAEEVWGTRYPTSGSVHLLEWPEVPAVEADMARWETIRETRAEALERIEPLRREKVIGSSLQAEVTVPTEIEGVDWAELFISSTVHHGDWAVTKSDHHKCGRCWRHLPEVAEDGDLCGRCETVVARMDEKA
ncbi:isoleucine--tRNA ligase [Aurantiacibacter xanthus]|uniref:Isoleucine--tRNA ligase n=1 Tax=Aurantiacibacter xanthus TaxID=1784712 RepID=A0A3A1P2I9_9SPHN|nr:isoleucine--tRNA ligase [Aurantiacibacter xanthus]RIV81764.1 isoleucine--tRNA ligase [Aurantiacibacter xanthus]